VTEKQQKLRILYLAIIRFVIPVVFNKLIRVECMFLSNITLFDGRGIYRVFHDFRT